MVYNKKQPDITGKMKRKIWRRIFTLLATFVLVFNSVVPLIAVAHADDTSPTPEVTQEITPTPDNPTPTPTIEQSQPTNTVTPMPTADQAIPTETITPTPDQTTITPTPKETIVVDATPTQSNDSSPPASNNSSDNNSSTNNSSISETPTTIPEPSNANSGEISAIILKNISAPNINLDATEEINSATLTTDKSDYAPTDTALISGSNLNSNTTYSLIISSNDKPATSTTKTVTSDENGVFVYTYRLDGKYRPNYKAELKNSADQFIASVTFTDTASPSFTVTGYDIHTPTYDTYHTSGYSWSSNCESIIVLNDGASILEATQNACGTTPSGWVSNHDYYDFTLPTSSHLVLQVYDGGNAEWVSSFEFTYPFDDDTTPPTITSVSSDGKTYKSNTLSPQKITITFNEDIATSPAILVNSSDQTVNNCNDTNDKTFCFYFTIPSNTDSTTETITISGATDESGNTMNTDNSHTFIVDTKAPTAAGTPITTTPTNNTTPTWNWTAATDANLDHYLFFWDTSEGGETNNSGDLSNSITSFQILAALIDGTWYGKVKAYDVAGNFSTSGNGSTLIDTDPPTVESAETQDLIENGKIDTIKLVFNENINDDQLALSGSDGWSVDGYTVNSVTSVQNGLPNDNNETLYLNLEEGLNFDTGNTPTVTYTQDGSPPQSTHDIAGNELNSDSWPTIDKASPNLTIDPIAGDYTSDQLATLTASEDTNIYYTTNGTTPDNASTSYTAPITIDKDMTIKAIAYDNAGNTSSILSATYGIAPTISDESTSSITDTSLNVTWTTDDPATSRVIYDTVSHQELGEAPNYGYASSTETFDSEPKVLSHSVSISGLTANTTYYYRTVSHGSPDAVGSQHSFSTTASPTSSNNTGGIGDGLSDGLGCGSNSCNNSTNVSQGQTLGISTSPIQESGSGVLGAITNSNEQNISPTSVPKEDVLGEETTPVNWSWLNLLKIFVIFLTVVFIIFILLKKRKKS